MLKHVGGVFTELERDKDGGIGIRFDARDIARARSACQPALREGYDIAGHLGGIRVLVKINPRFHARGELATVYACQKRISARHGCYPSFMMKSRPPMRESNHDPAG